MEGGDLKLIAPKGSQASPAKDEVFWKFREKL
jgi:hypothetical protein